MEENVADIVIPDEMPLRDAQVDPKDPNIIIYRGGEVSGWTQKDSLQLRINSASPNDSNAVVVYKDRTFALPLHCTFNSPEYLALMESHGKSIFGLQVHELKPSEFKDDSTEAQADTKKVSAVDSPAIDPTPKDTTPASERPAL